MASNRYLATLLGSLFLLTFCAGALNYLVDPLQYFRLSGYPQMLSKEQRYQAPGLVKNYPYQALIIGTSLMDNMSSEKIEQAIGMKTLNAAMNGSSIYEQYLLLSLALRSGRPKVVIWGVTPTALVADQASKVRSDLGTFPYWLYSKSPIEQALYLLNTSTTWDTIKIASTHVFSFPKYEHLSVDMLNHFPKDWKFGQEKALAAFNVFLDERGGQSKSRNIQNNTAPNCNNDNGLVYENYVQSVIKDYPEVQFHIVLPPVSILAYLADAPPYTQIACSDGIISKLLDNKNVTVHDFRSDEKVITNLDNYMDTTHFSSEISDYMIESLHAKKYAVVKNEANEATHRLISLVTRYYDKKEEFLGSYSH